MQLEPGHATRLLAAPDMLDRDELLLTNPGDASISKMPEQDELLLTENYEAPEAERVRPAEDSEMALKQASEPEELDLSQSAETEASVFSEELVLDDLADFGPNSRVVRLFDPAAMPRAGQIGAGINRDLQGEPAQIQSAEAAQALQDALAELRRAIPNRLR